MENPGNKARGLGQHSHRYVHIVILAPQQHILHKLDTFGIEACHITDIQHPKCNNHILLHPLPHLYYVEFQLTDEYC